MSASTQRQPKITDYGMVGDCRSAALISKEGSVDWWCLPRFDSGSCFGRLLDPEGGHCAFGVPDAETSRRYVGQTLVLETTFESEGGQAVLRDAMVVPEEGERLGDRRLFRRLECIRGEVPCRLEIVPRFDYGAVKAWIRRHDRNWFSAIGGDDGLLISADFEIGHLDGARSALGSECRVRAGEVLRLELRFEEPVVIDDDPPEPPSAETFDGLLDRTVEWWECWAGGIDLPGPDEVESCRSALILKGLSYEPTGAICAAATTSLPEGVGAQGSRNYDYRFSWIRDSALSVRSLARLGFEREALRFRRFIERSAAGYAEDLQVAYGVDGERRISGSEVESLRGFGNAQPVRVGNGAIGQLQLDAFGMVVEQSWRWYERGHEPDDDYWRFIVDLVNRAVECWEEPDCGFWEWPGEPKHFVHSKVQCWLAVDRGLRLAEACMRKAPEQRWREARDQIAEAVMERGFDPDRNSFTQAFDAPDLDAVALRLPITGFVDWKDERMIGTVEAVGEELSWGGALKRYDDDDGIDVPEGAFVACSFWLAECLARQDRPEHARDVYEATMATANDLGLFSEEWDPDRREMLGNMPQALSHLSQLEAALALGDAEG